MADRFQARYGHARADQARVQLGGGVELAGESRCGSTTATILQPRRDAACGRGADQLFFGRARIFLLRRLLEVIRAGRGRGSLEAPARFAASAS